MAIYRSKKLAIYWPVCKLIWC